MPTRLVTGNIAILTGEARAGLKMTLTRRITSDVFAQDNQAIVNEPVTVVTEQDGDFSVNLWPGQYDVVAVGSNGQKRCTYSLTADGSTDFADGIGQAAPLLASAAELARDKAREWAENPENDAVEPGRYSALHHSAKAQLERLAAETAKLAAQAAQIAVEALQIANIRNEIIAAVWNPTAILAGRGQWFLAGAWDDSALTSNWTENGGWTDAVATA